MAGVSVVALSIAAWFAAQGYWVILPFAGLELSALGAALWVTQLRNRYREVVHFGDDHIRIEFGLAGRDCKVKSSMPRAWTRCLLESGSHRNAPNRLLLSCSGQQLEIGSCLTDEERQALAGRMRELLAMRWDTQTENSAAAALDAHN